MLVTLLQYAAKLAFLGLGILAARDWLRQRDWRHGYLALALGMLGITALVGIVTQALGFTTQPPPAAGFLEVAAFQASGWALLMFRHTFIPLPRWARVLAPVALALAAVVVEAIPILLGTSQPALLEAGILFLVVSWSLCVGEPAVRFWIAARRLPTVQRRRLRAVSYAYAGLIPVLVLGSISLGQNTGTTVLVSVLALLAAPALYAAFTPPRILRLLWREEEEERYRLAFNELVGFAPDRRTLAERAVEWAVRLVGGSGGAVLEPDGTLLAIANMDPMKATRLAARSPQPPGQEVLADVDGGTMIGIPLRLDTGEGHLIVMGGRFTPLFASEEVHRLLQYGASLAVALDRARLSERMRALEDTKSRFLRLASHELRGPLTLIRGYVSMLDEGAISPEQMHGITSVLLSRVAQMTQMLNQMLETARLEDERLELNLEEFDLRDAADAVSTAITPFAAGHKLVRAFPAEPVLVTADRARVENILTILLDNAIKYSPGGGAVCCNIRKEGLAGVAEVEDEGIGIAAEDLQFLFTRFGRLHHPATSAVSGTGLGLYLSRELARRQGGDLAVGSEPGKGSKFVLSLPLAQEAAPVA